ncbi:hypothetical protein QW131_24360 [Roseibium salinum]|nr:hypothetical protein [Roseibium salinum]
MSEKESASSEKIEEKHAEDKGAVLSEKPVSAHAPPACRRSSKKAERARNTIVSPRNPSHRTDMKFVFGMAVCFRP